MAKSVNQVILLGRIVNSIELKTTPSGKNVASFSLAVDKPGNDSGADFFEINAWDKLADLLDQYTQKGSKILVQGRLGQQTWDDKQTGKKRNKVNITANDVTFLDSPKSSNGYNNRNSSQDKLPEDVDDKPLDLSEIPF